jgi:cell division protein FtsQ
LKKKITIWDLLWFIVPVVLISTASFVSKDLKCTEVKVKIRETDNSRFLDERKVLQDVQDHLGYPLIGGKLIHKDLSSIEMLLKNNKFVHSADVISDHKGRVTLNIEQECPIARIIAGDSSYYLSKTGRLFPTSHQYSARVTMVLGNKVNQILRTDSTANKEERQAFVDLMNYLYNDPFLKAQIETIEVLEDKKMIFFPQITSQKILFGNCEEYVDKLDKLKIFYSQILPRKGWETYSTVNLDYKNQIICE